MNTKKKKRPAFITSLSLKNIVKGWADDPYSLKCSVYLNGEIMADYVNADLGSGGELIFKTSGAEEKFKAFCQEESVAEFMFKNGWDFLKTIEEIPFDAVAEYLIYNSFAKHNSESKINVKEI